MPCVHSPYDTDGSGYWCTGYQWGMKRNDTTGKNIYSSRGYAHRNCTDYVAWKLQSLGVTANLTGGLGNGGQWYENAANKSELKRGTVPKVGAAAVVPHDTPDYGGYGHVAYVEAVHSDGTMTVSEYNRDRDGAGSVRRGKPSDMKFTQFIYFGEHMTNPPSDPTPTRPTLSNTLPWTFENLEGDSGAMSPHSANVGRTPAAIEFNNQLYVFHYDKDNGNLRYARTTPGWTFGILDGAGGTNGRVNRDVGRTPAAVVHNNQLHVFYYDADAGNLRHARSSNGTDWSFQNLDGDPGSIGRKDADLGQTPAAAVFGTSLQLLYYDATNTNLRHAWLSNGTWKFENFEGDAGSVSGYTGNVGLDPTLQVHNGTLQAFYYDAGQKNLRHAWADSKGWHFQNLDGDAGSVGGLSADLGKNPAAAVYNNTLQVFYYDESNGNLRHAWSDSSGWHFETMEGDPNALLGYDSNVGAMPTVAVVGTTLQVFAYEPQWGALRHYWVDATGWHAENLDGLGGNPAGRRNGNVGADPVAIAFGGGLQLFYYDVDRGDLRHAVPN